MANFMTLIRVAALVAIPATTSPARADKCDALAPTNAQDITKDFQGKVDGEIRGWVSRIAGGGASVEGSYKEIEKDVLSKYPDANKLYVWQRIFYLACVDPSRNIDFNDLLRGYLNSPLTTSGQLSNGTAVNSNGQTGGITAGTINISEPHAPGNPKVIDAIALFMDQGSEIAHAWETTGDDTTLTQAIEPWTSRVYIYLQNTLGPAYAIQFKNTHELSAIGLNGRSTAVMPYWHEVLGKVHFLNELLNELRRQ
jgi:hypothetical protein